MMYREEFQNPVGKPFINGENFYYYDTFTNKILKISEELYKSIFGIINKGMMTESKGEEIVLRRLKRMGFFHGPFIEPEIRELPFEDILFRHVSRIQLQVTKDCNFLCRYCFFANDNNITRNHEDDYMKDDIAKKAIDFLFDHSYDSEEIGISFYGGEPLLNFELIRNTINYAKSKFFFKKIRYSITTNGSILNEQMICFLAENKVHLLISADGPSDMQNNHRKFRGNGYETYNVVWNNINFIRENYSDYFKNHVTFNPVLFADDKLDDVIKFFGNINLLDKIKVGGYANMKGIDYIYDINKMVGSSTELSYEQFNREQLDRIKSSLMSPELISSNELPLHGCIPGANRLFIATDGKFYPCEKVNEYEELSIGDINNGFDFIKIARLSTIFDFTLKECKMCWASRLCNMCIIHCTNVEKKCIDRETKLNYCKFIKKIALTGLIKIVSERGKQNG